MSLGTYSFLYLLNISVKTSQHYIKITAIVLQVSLAIRGGYVPLKSKTANTKSFILGLNNANLGLK